MANHDGTNGCGQHSGVTTMLENHERRLGEHDQLIQKMFDKLDRVLTRPGWSVTVIISVLCSLLAIASTIALKK